MNKRKETIIEEIFDEQGRVIKRVTTTTEEEEETPAPITTNQPYDPTWGQIYCQTGTDTASTYDPNQLTLDLPTGK